jgi:hypothetical protein
MTHCKVILNYIMYVLRSGLAAAYTACRRQDQNVRSALKIQRVMSAPNQGTICITLLLPAPR